MIKRKRTATTSNALLGLLALRPTWATYAITKQLSRNLRFFWPRAESRIYDEANQLVVRGLAQATEERFGQRTRNIYSITRAGRQVLKEWLATRPSPTRLECEPLLRIFLADFCTQEQLFNALNQVKEDADAIMAVGQEVGPEYLQGIAPFQDQVHTRALVFDFLWNHAKMLRDWAERTEGVISDWEHLLPEERAKAAQDMIRKNLNSFSA